MLLAAGFVSQFLFCILLCVRVQKRLECSTRKHRSAIRCECVVQTCFSAKFPNNYHKPLYEAFTSLHRMAYMPCACTVCGIKLSVPMFERCCPTRSEIRPYFAVENQNNHEFDIRVYLRSGPSLCYFRVQT